ncbi:hypothetical protein DVH24_020207 [Malus domestica]|uniref:Uncharacterized protein n=1 Tax=Malus domestica TaxID=3750 RepID=A0A498JAM8_MALDO|nr:hypothetical protein DVH24_020207 [Malus domestica]
MKRRIIRHDDCLLCGCYPETIVHVLRDSFMASAILGSRTHNSHNLSLRDWISQLARTASKKTFDLILILIRAGAEGVQVVLPHRAPKSEGNDVLWIGKTTTPRELVVNAEGWLQSYKQWHSPTKRSHGVAKQRWSSPNLGANFDGAWDERTRRGGIGVIVRDDAGDFCGCSFRCRRTCIRTITGPTFGGRRAVLFIQSLFPEGREVISEVKLNFVPREANNVAHSLARSGIGRQAEVSWFKELPDIIMDTLQEDKAE